MPQTVSPPPDVCGKCGWYIGYAPNHYRVHCNPVGGKAADDLSAKLADVARSTKSGHQDSLTFIFGDGSTLVLKVDRAGRFAIESIHLIRGYDSAGMDSVVRLFAEFCGVTRS